MFNARKARRLQKHNLLRDEKAFVREDVLKRVEEYINVAPNIRNTGLMITYDRGMSEGALAHSDVDPFTGEFFIKEYDIEKIVKYLRKLKFRAEYQVDDIVRLYIAW